MPLAGHPERMKIDTSDARITLRTSGLSGSGYGVSFREERGISVRPFADKRRFLNKLEMTVRASFS
jgi:hypothetical protein